MRRRSPGSFFSFSPRRGEGGFGSELLRMLRAHGVEFDERYVFD
jgi:hypothetical protein